MTNRATHLECTHACPWKNTAQCLRHLVKESVIQCGHLGSGQMSGVRSMYYPHELPPCVKADGSLHWDHIEKPAEPVLLVWEDDSPPL